MWILTQHGYVSVVQKRVTEPDVLTVRARDRRSLDEFCLRAGLPADAPVMELPSDYPWRVRCSREDVSRYFACELDELDYSNFKSRVTKTRGKLWHDVLLTFWTASLRLTSRADKEAGYRAWDEYDREHKIGKYAPARTGRGSKGKALAADAGGIIAEHFGFNDLTDEELGAFARWEDEEALRRGKSVHDLTEAEWVALMEENPSGI